MVFDPGQKYSLTVFTAEMSISSSRMAELKIVCFFDNKCAFNESIGIGFMSILPL